MPITSSAKKALRQSHRRRKHNNFRREAYKSTVKNFRKLVTSKKLEEAREELKKAMQTLDKAAKSKTIKRNKASRLKSRLQKALTKISV